MGTENADGFGTAADLHGRVAALAYDSKTDARAYHAESNWLRRMADVMECVRGPAVYMSTAVGAAMIGIPPFPKWARGVAVIGLAATGVFEAQYRALRPDRASKMLRAAANNHEELCTRARAGVLALETAVARGQSEPPPDLLDFWQSLEYGRIDLLRRYPPPSEWARRKAASEVVQLPPQQ